MADIFCGSVQHTAVLQWAALTAYSVGDIRRQLAAPAVGNERVFRVTTAGTSGAAEPTWNLGAAATTADATVTWTEITGSSTYNTLGGTWSAPHARMRVAATRMAVADRMFVRNDHSATEAATVTISLPGTTASPNQVLGVNAAGALAMGAIEITTGTNELIITTAGCAYVYGIRFDCGTGAGGPSLRVGNFGGGNTEQIVTEDCDFVINATGADGHIVLRNDGGGRGESRHIRPRFRFGRTTSQNVILCGISVHIQGGGALAGGAAITYLFSFNSAKRVLIEGHDFSGYHAAIDIFGSAGGGHGVVRNCKLPAAWTGSLFNFQPALRDRAEMYNCSEGDHNYRILIEDDLAIQREEIVIVRTGGASDGATPLSWRIATTADAEYPARVFRSPEIFMPFITAIGAPRTVTVEILHDSLTALTDAEIWIEVQYLGTAGFPLSLFLADAKADVLATAANQTVSTVAWTTTGITNVNKQKLEVTFTPQERGVAIVTVCVAKASYTVYVDPKATLT